MKFTCIRESLREAILLVEKNAAKKITLPVLGSILFTAEKGKITLTSTNLEIGTEAWVNGKIIEEGKVAVPARVISSYIGALKDDQVMFASDKENLLVTTDTSKTLVKGYLVDDFPLLPKIKKEDVFTIPAEHLRTAISKVALAAAVSDIKPELASVLFKFSKDTLKITATDSFRLAERVVSGSFGSPSSVSYFLLPIRSATELSRLLDFSSGDIEVAITKGQIVFSSSRFLMISRLTEGNFPEYERIIPAKFTTTCLVKKEDILSTLHAISLFSGKLSDVSLAVQPKTGTVSFKTSNADVGEYASDIKADAEGEELQVSFNYRYITDGINQIDSPEVFLGFSSATGPLLIKNKNESGYLYLAMPMKV